MTVLFFNMFVQYACPFCEMCQNEPRCAHKNVCPAVRVKSEFMGYNGQRHIEAKLWAKVGQDQDLYVQHLSWICLSLMVYIMPRAGDGLHQTMALKTCSRQCLENVQLLSKHAMSLQKGRVGKVQHQDKRWTKKRFTSILKLSIFCLAAGLIGGKSKESFVHFLSSFCSMPFG